MDRSAKKPMKKGEREIHDIFDRIMNLPGLRIMWPFYSKFKDKLLYLFFGALTTLVNLVVFYLLTEKPWQINVTVGNVISVILAILFAYVTNKIWVFNSKTDGAKELAAEFVRFVGGRMSTMFIEVGGVYLIYNVMGHSKMTAKLITQVIVIIGNYFISKFLVFRGDGGSER